MQYFKEWDYQLFNYINHSFSNRFFDILMPVSRNASTWIPLYVLLGIFIIQTFKRNAWIYIAYIIIVFALTDALSYQVLKPFFGRLRPCHDPFFHARLLLNHCGSNFGFPSNHAANHMGLTISIILLRIFKSNLSTALLVAWPLLIGFAQIYVGVHYPADIIAGYLTGALISVSIYFIGKATLTIVSMNTTTIK